MLWNAELNLTTAMDKCDEIIPTTIDGIESAKRPKEADEFTPDEAVRLAKGVAEKSEFPAVRTLQSWMKKVSCQPRIIAPVVAMMTAEGKKLTDMDKVCVLMADDMKVRKVCGESQGFYIVK